MPVNQDIIIEQGATFEETFTITGIDLSTFSARAQGRTTHASTTTAITFVAVTAYTPPNSTITISLTATQTTALTAPSSGVFDVEYFFGAFVGRGVEGSYTVTPEVTR
jgi:hypothetical protein